MTAANTANSMFTIGNTTRKRVTKKEDHLIAQRFAFTDTTAIGDGVLVKLDETIEYGVKACTGTTDDAVGTVFAGTTLVDGLQHITVNTFFQIISRATCKGAIAVGDKLAPYGIDLTNSGLMQYKKAVAGDTVVAVALEAGSVDGEEIGVGVYRVPYISGVNNPANQAATVAANGAAALGAVAASFADEAAARTAVDALKSDANTQIQTLKTTVNAILVALKAAGIMAP